MEQVRLYNNQVSPTKRLSETLQRTMLENAVHPLQELRAVKLQAEQHKTQTGKSLSLLEYSQLLQSAAVTYDAQFNKDKNTRRSVLFHDFLPNEDCSTEDNALQFDIDSPVEALQVFQASTRKKEFTP